MPGQQEQTSPDPTKIVRRPRLVTGDRLLGVSFPLVLGANVAGSATIRGIRVSGTSTCKYKITPYSNFTSHLTITSNFHASVYKDVEAEADALAGFIIRNLELVSSKKVPYDTRALGYSLGRRLALLGIGQAVSMATCQVLSLKYPRYDDPPFDNLLVVTPRPGWYSTPVLTAYAHLASDCGIEHLYVADDNVQLVVEELRTNKLIELYMYVGN